MKYCVEIFELQCNLQKQKNADFIQNSNILMYFSVYRWIDLDLETLYSKISEEYFRENKMPIFKDSIF